MGLCAHCATPLPDGSRFCSHCGTPVPGKPEHSPTLTPQGREIFDRLRDTTAGRYEILRELGRGGMAVVFLAYQQSLDRQIAIKVLMPFLAYDTELVERFLREARTQGKLDHPCIIKVFEVHSEGGLTFFTMPYISGRSLRTLLQDDPQPPFMQVHRYLCQAADALAYAHRRGVIHRDVKPDNMVLDEERDCVILTDFGIAKALAAETTLTTPGDLLGTPQYMSPEQGEGRQDLDGRADQYSLGLIAYEMLAGQRAFRADNLAELMYKHRFEEPESLDRLRPDAPPEMRRAIMRAINKDRDDRFPTMEGFLSALEACSTELAEMGEDRTEPMPPPGSGDTTVRVPTPPGRMHTGQTPPPVSPASPRVRSPGRTPPPAWSRTPSGRTPPPSRTPGPGRITPTPGRTGPPPGGTPRPRGQTPTPPELEIPTYLEATTPRRSRQASAAPGSRAVAPTITPEPSAPAMPIARPRRRRRRVGRAVVVLLALAATLAGLVVWGPLRPMIERYLRPGAETEADTPDLAVLPAQEREATGLSEQAADLLSPGGGQGGPEAMPVADEETTVTGQQTAAGEGERTAQPAMLAPDESAAREPEAEVAGALATARAAAESAGNSAGDARREARAARAHELFEDAYAGVVAQLESANRAFNRRQYDAASTGYASAASGFRLLARRATTALERGGASALAAKQAMNAQRDSARAAGAVERAPQGLIGANIVANQAQAEFERGNYEAATDLFAQAGDLYAGVLATLTAPLAVQRPTQGAQRTQTPPPEEQPVVEPAADSAAQAEADTQPEEARPEVAVPPEQIVSGMVDRFRVLFAAENEAGMSRELYKGAIPSGDRRVLNAVFGGADDIEITRFNHQINVNGMRAGADIDLHMRFRQGTTRESRERDLKLRLHFEASGPGEWRLRRLEVR